MLPLACIYWYTAIFVWMHSSVVYTQDGCQFISADSYCYGNNVTERSAYLPSGARKSYIDSGTVLPAGVLQKYFMYIHHVISQTTSETSTKIWMQIWRPVDVVNHRYKLVWSRAATVRIDQPGGTLNEYEAHDNFRVNVEDRIGWTNEATYGSISFQSTESHKTYYRDVANNQFPVINNDYSFDTMYLPGIFSVAVQIMPDVSHDNCSYNCKEVAEGRTCEKTTGKCIAGCKTPPRQNWYFGITCDSPIPYVEIESKNIPAIQDVTTKSLTLKWDGHPEVRGVLRYFYKKRLYYSICGSDGQAIANKTYDWRDQLFIAKLLPETTYCIQLSLLRDNDNGMVEESVRKSNIVKFTTASLSGSTTESKPMNMTSTLTVPEYGTVSQISYDKLKVTMTAFATAFGVAMSIIIILVIAFICLYRKKKSSSHTETNEMKTKDKKIDFEAPRNGDSPFHTAL